MFNLRVGPAPVRAEFRRNPERNGVYFKQCRFSIEVAHNGVPFPLFTFN